MGVDAIMTNENKSLVECVKDWFAQSPYWHTIQTIRLTENRDEIEIDFITGITDDRITLIANRLKSDGFKVDNTEVETGIFKHLRPRILVSQPAAVEETMGVGAIMTTEFTVNNTVITSIDDYRNLQAERDDLKRQLAAVAQWTRLILDLAQGAINMSPKATHYDDSLQLALNNIIKYARLATTTPPAAPDKALRNIQPLIDLWRAWCNDEDTDDDDLFAEWIAVQYLANDEALRTMFRNLEHGVAKAAKPASESAAVDVNALVEAVKQVIALAPSKFTYWNARQILSAALLASLGVGNTP